MPKNEITAHLPEPETESRASKASKNKNKKKESNMTAAVTTGKTTQGHHSTQEARDKAYDVRTIKNLSSGSSSIQSSSKPVTRLQ